MNIAQQIAAFDSHYSMCRTANSPRIRTLYLKRRTQLLRENTKKELDPNIRKQYLKIRTQILTIKYGSVPDLRSRDPSIRSRAESLYEQPIGSVSLQLGSSSPSSTNRSPRHSRLQSDSSFSFLRPRSTSLGSINYEDKNTAANNTKSLIVPQLDNENVIPTEDAKASKKLAGNQNIEQYYQFEPVYHVFHQHMKAVKVVKFANEERDRLACCSVDGTISILRLNPPTVQFVLKGHTNSINDLSWSLTNDLIMSASSDKTTRIWNSVGGSCLRVVNDYGSSEVNCCIFHPVNNNHVVTGNSKWQVQVYNTSTGKRIKGGGNKVSGVVKCLAFDINGKILWSGDTKGHIYSFIFDTMTGKIIKSRKITINEGSPITSIVSRSWSNREGKNPVLLMNTMRDSLWLLRIISPDGNAELKSSYPVWHSKQDIKSTFCPIMSFREGACVVTGSEDLCVHLYNIEKNDENASVNILHGHSAPVLGVSWNYDESFLASSDSLGMVFIWKRKINCNSDKDDNPSLENQVEDD
ncbi:WD repeat-containing protein 13 [Trichoplax sp. H2]|nr:WD repeat-containing protein 13 [Trichoplax sp. H2]|eukprot:RDD45250.1 WD repeat-containing protein 13 [Trichoplax sp. H2]